MPDNQPVEPGAGDSKQTSRLSLVPAGLGKYAHDLLALCFA